MNYYLRLMKKKAINQKASVIINFEFIDLMMMVFIFYISLNIN